MTNLILAHAGHGAGNGHSAMHYLTEPVHLLVLAAGIATVAIGVWLTRRRLNTLKWQQINSRSQ